MSSLVFATLLCPYDSLNGFFLLFPSDFLTFAFLSSDGKPCLSLIFDVYSPMAANPACQDLDGGWIAWLIRKGGFGNSSRMVREVIRKEGLAGELEAIGFFLGYTGDGTASLGAVKDLVEIK